MTTNRNLRPREPRAMQFLRQAARAAEDLPVTGTALRRVQDAESWALIELKQRLETLDETAGDPAPEHQDGDPDSAARMLADLLTQSHDVDPAAARDRLYRQTLNRLVPDQAAMLALLADRGRAPLCHVAASRLPAGPVTMVILANASSLGRDAGVLLRDHVPHYMSAMLHMGLLEIQPEDSALAEEYELLQADALVRNTMERIRGDLKMHPRVQKFSVVLSSFGQSLWRDCGPDNIVPDAGAVTRSHGE